MTEVNALRVAVALAGFVPVSAGLAGLLMGTGILDGAPGPAADSHTRYLSGLLLGIGLMFWASIPGIARHGARFRLLGALVVLGGLGRLLGVVLHGWPPLPHALALVMELVVTPALVLWQARIARE